MAVNVLREIVNYFKEEIGKAIESNESVINAIETSRENMNQKKSEKKKEVHVKVTKAEDKAKVMAKDAKAAVEETKEKATIAAIEAKAIADEIAAEATEEAEKKIQKVQQTGAKAKATVKKAETRASEAADKAREVKTAVKKTKVKAKATAAAVSEKVEKAGQTAQKTRAKAKETKNKVESKASKAAEKAEKKGPVKRTAAKTPDAKPVEVFIQSPNGKEITPEAILEKVGEADIVYVRVDQNKAYWVNGEKHGEIDLW